MKTKVATVVILAAALVLSGCGGNISPSQIAINGACSNAELYKMIAGGLIDIGDSPNARPNALNEVVQDARVSHLPGAGSSLDAEAIRNTFADALQLVADAVAIKDINAFKLATLEMETSIKKIGKSCEAAGWKFNYNQDGWSN